MCSLKTTVPIMQTQLIVSVQISVGTETSRYLESCGQKVKRLKTVL